MAASVEQNSEHPLAAAIVHGEKERNVKLQSVADFLPSPAAESSESGRA